MFSVRVALAEIPADGSFKVLALLGRKIGVRRLEDGSLIAFDLRCRHQNADLSQAPRAGDVVTCLRHGWRYDLRTGECLTESWACLRRHPVAVEGDHATIATRAAEDGT